ncbi:hypothetical protein Q9Q99_15010 [Curtobacterium flaccumfaciens]|nr:hypothetical protein Q9Q99_15010 [Curtobacterium flaccumfaciens]
MSTVTETPTGTVPATGAAPASASDRVVAPRGRRVHTRRRHGFGFWVVAFAFLTVMAFATVPAPLYVIYQARDGFPDVHHDGDLRRVRGGGRRVAVPGGAPQ